MYLRLTRPAAGTWQAAGGGGGWTDNGAYVRLSTPMDSVGIGTSQPTAKLHVRGVGFEEVKVESDVSFG